MKRATHIRINHIVVELRLTYFDRYWYRNPYNTDYNTIRSTIFSTLLWCWMDKDRQNEIGHKCLLSCALHAMLKSTHFFLLFAVQLNCAHVNPFRLLHRFGFYAFEHWMHTIIDKSSNPDDWFQSWLSSATLLCVFNMTGFFSFSLLFFIDMIIILKVRIHSLKQHRQFQLDSCACVHVAQKFSSLFQVFFLLVHFIWLDPFFVSVSIVYYSF